MQSRVKATDFWLAALAFGALLVAVTAQGGYTGPGTTCTALYVSILPKPLAMANSIETFYSGNLATLARDLGAPSVVSFTVNRLPLVDGGGNVVGWEYSAEVVITTTDSATYVPRYNQLMLDRLSVPASQVTTTEVQRSANLFITAVFNDPPTTPTDTSPSPPTPPPPSPSPPPPPPSPSPPPPTSTPTTIPTPSVGSVPPPPVAGIYPTRCPGLPNQCSLQGICDMANNYTCQCNNGYAGPSCVDNASLAGCDPTVAATCDRNAHCINIELDPLLNPRYACKCFTGYLGDGTTCEDDDECMRRPCFFTPIAKATCTNVPGFYWCNCPAGYSGDAYTNCTDINECAATPSPCDVNADCENILGSYTCLCRTGYTGNGYTCSRLVATPPPVNVGPPPGVVTAFKVQQLVMPEMTCWTRSLSQYTAYFAYNNKGKDVSIRVALDNMVNVNGYPYNNGYPGGQPTWFPKGFNYGLFIHNGMPGNGTASWRVDGNIASINAASADFIKYRCPKSIKITTRVTINCADDLNHAAAVMRDNLVVLLRAATKKFGVAETLVDNIALDAGVLNCAAGQGDATFILTDPDVADRDQLEVSVFDMLFPILRDHTLSSVANVPDMAGVGPATGTSAYSGIAKDAAILAKPGESAIAPEAPPCDIEVIWCFTWMLFIIVVGCIVLFLILVAIAVILILRRRKLAKAERA